MEKSLLQFDDVSFFYPRIEDDEAGSIHAIETTAEITPVFQHLTLSIPEGVASLVGQNGIGKTTFLLLAGARLFPAEGRVRLAGHDTSEFQNREADAGIEQARNRLVSFIYQNMEFETDQSVDQLMRYIFESGDLGADEASLTEDLRRALELDLILDRKLQALSKGQMQRAIIAFSLLYGSRVIMMDEPAFALEEPHKERVFEYLTDYARRYHRTIYYSAHSLDITRRYSDYMILFHKGGRVLVGPTAELYNRDTLEQAYQVPMDALYQRDRLYRDMLISLGKRSG
ncbi:MAG TPA: ABC transporter ATP-binding protein [Spirochaetia bacterium]|nr:ABC transporter ATP-binding protein [Spirochaetia bacterium]